MDAPECRLSEFTTAELRAEIRRREHEPVKNRIFCDDCAHFVPWGGPIDETPPDSFNPCSKGHKMKFACPLDDYLGDDTGFYRPGCKDRKTP